MNRIAVVIAVFCLTASAMAQATAAAMGNSQSQPNQKGWTSYVLFQGSSNSLGQVMDLDTSVGYNFGSHFGIDGGVPIYFVQGTSATGTSISNNGLGNIYGDIRLKFPNPLLNYNTILTGYAPTGDSSLGFSTGRATFTWNNRVDHSFGPLTPFVGFSLGNTIANTQLFNRPFTSLGYNAEFEGGAEYSLWRFIGVGASAYDIAPMGQQKLFSKFVNQASGPPSQAKNNRFFQTSPEVTGPASIAEDNGFSAWVDSSPVPFLDLQLGYTHSIQYSLDTVSFGVGLNVGWIVRKSGH